MSFNPIFGTGFEMGSSEIFDDVDRENSPPFGAFVDATNPHTGSYALRLTAQSKGTGWGRFPVGGSQAELYVSLYFDPEALWGSSTNTWGSIIFVLSDGNEIELRMYNQNTKFGLYVGGSKVEDGIIAPQNGYQNIQIHVIASNVGLFHSKIGGIPDITYDGDTLPGVSNTIEYVRFEYTVNELAHLADDIHIDDLVIGDDGWPGDMRFDPLLAVGDTVVEDWDLSAGADSYALLDERPPSDADYIFSTVNGEQTIVELDSWDAVDKTPEFVMIWARAKKDVAAAHQIKLVDSDGVNTDIGDAQDLLTSYSYLWEMLPAAPDGFQWSDTKVDTLNLGVESVVV